MTRKGQSTATARGEESASAGPPSLLSRRLVVVSNRQPYKHVYDGEEVTVDRPTGGLTAGLDPVLRRVGGTWIAWGDGDADRAVTDGDGVEVPPEDPSYTLRRVWLSEPEVRDYYYGFSNQVLWPICHSSLAHVECEESYWDRYGTVNERFADRVVEAIDATADGAGGGDADGGGDGDESPVVWFQDYHLALAPRMVRRRLPETPVLMHFWHIPWPAWDTFRACPRARTLLEGLLGNDQLGFHVERYRDNFLECIERGLDGATVDRRTGEVDYRDHRTRTVAVPLGVDVEDVATTAASDEGTAAWSSFANANGISGDERVAVGVDRLDYSKGIPQRLRALERFWEVHPDWRGELTFVQNASESRTRIPAYREVCERVERAVERINDRFGTDDWQPVVFTTDRLSQEELYGLYRHADLAVVSAIRDGMNLVAQEYVAAQGDDPGVLLLSDQTGAYDTMGEHALGVSPHDVSEFQSAIATALSMSREERRRRMDRLQRCVEAQDVSRWVERLVGAATAARRTPAAGTG